MRVALILGMSLLTIGYVAAHGPQPGVEVLVDGNPVPNYFHRGTTYLEAAKGKEYAIRITNPIGTRVAVALSVDGLNTIDARHTEARLGRKWVLAPYESIVISGWQTNAKQARRFFFTNEERSYGAWLGQTEDLGVISAAFFRERTQRFYAQDGSLSAPEEPARKDSGTAAPARAKQNESGVAAPADEAGYAATGIGQRVDHEVRQVHMDLEDKPFALVNLRYEFRPALVRLGVVPPPSIDDPLARRERAKGFRGTGFCPEP